MRKILTILLLASTASTAQAKTLTIGIDLSASNPLLSHKNFAHVASQHVSSEINKLKDGDVVHVKTFGSRKDALNLLNPTFEISRRLKPSKVAGIVAQYIRSLPEQKEASQSSTNLIAWLEFTSEFNCAQNSQILVITDGLESSSYVDGNQLLQGKKSLPKAEVNLKGCALTFYGLGAGWMPQQVKIVRKEWERWSEQAGAAFTAIIP